jgi:hypothetical protein
MDMVEPVALHLLVAMVELELSAMVLLLQVEALVLCQLQSQMVALVEQTNTEPSVASVAELAGGAAEAAEAATLVALAANGQLLATVVVAVHFLLVHQHQSHH